MRGCIRQVGFLRQIAALALLWTLTACGDNPEEGGEDTGPDTPAETFEFSIGEADEDGAFTPVGSGDSVEIVVGFQGLIFIDLILDAPADVEWRMAVECDITFAERPDYDFGFRVNRLQMATVAGRRLGELRVPFGQDVSLIHGQDITVDVRLSATGWEGQSSASFRIADDERCIEDPDGELECE